MRNSIIAHNDPLGLFDPFFDEFFTSESNSHFNQIMRTDIKDNGDHYEFQIELPEVKKHDIKLSLDDGYLTIEATHEEKAKKHEKSHYVRKERYYGSYKRSFYVGDEIKNEDIKAKLNDGILFLTINKREPEEAKPNYIDIE